MEVLLLLLGLLGNSAAMPVSVSFNVGRFLCILLLHSLGKTDRLFQLRLCISSSVPDANAPDAWI